MTSHESNATKRSRSRADGEVFSDLKSIKKSILGATENIKDASVDGIHAATDYVSDRVDDLKATGASKIKKVESRIKSKPGQSVAIAFIAGVLTSFIFGRRSS